MVANGNITDDGIRLYAYDALNRLKQVKRKSDDATIAEYTYDAFGRRIRKVVSNGGKASIRNRRKQLPEDLCGVNRDVHLFLRDTREKESNISKPPGDKLPQG